MDTAQVLLIVVVSVLALLIVILGIQVLLILKEFKGTLSRVNKVIDNAQNITESISKPVSNFSTILSGVKLGSILASLLKGKHHKKEEE